MSLWKRKIANRQCGMDRTCEETMMICHLHFSIVWFLSKEWWVKEEKKTKMMVRRNNNYGGCCSDVISVSEDIGRELRGYEGDEMGVTLFALSEGIYLRDFGYCGLCMKDSLEKSA